MPVKKLLQSCSAFARVLVVAAAAFLVGCGGGDVAPAAAPTSLIGGWAAAGDPLQGAALTFYRLDGQQVDLPEPVTTSQFGSFSAPPGLPAEFRVTARGGAYAGEPFGGTLVAEHRATWNSSVIQINPVTTMVSVYAADHPDESLEEATSRVKRFLAMPDTFDIRTGLTRRNPYFDHAAFMSQAAEAGGMDVFVRRLITEMATHPAATHSFPVDVTAAMPRSAGSFIAKALAEGAASYVGGQAVGWALKESGMWDPDAEARGEVTKMQAALADLKNQLDGLKSHMDEIEHRLSAEMNKHAYSQRVATMYPLISGIHNLKDRLVIFATSPPKDQVARDTQREHIMNSINDLQLSASVIHFNQTGEGGAESLISLINKVASGDSRYVQADPFNEAIQVQFEYFQKLQEWELLLAVEYYHANGEGDGYTPMITTRLAAFNSNLDAQQKLLRTLPEHTMVDSTQQLMLLLRGEDQPPTIRYEWLPDGSFAVITEVLHTTYPVRMGRQDFISQELPTLNTATAYGGFKWRQPYHHEVDAFLRGHGDCSGGRGAEYLKSLGWPSPSRDLMLGTADYMPDGWMTYFKIYTLDKCGMDDYLVWDLARGHELNRTADWIPVRSIPTDEYAKYFY